MLNNPLEQFEISTLIAFHIGNFDFSLTNSTFFVILALTFILFLFLLSLIYQTIIPNRWQYLIEGSYSFILGLVNDIISIKKSQNFFSFCLCNIYYYFCNKFNRYGTI